MFRAAVFSWTQCSSSLLLLLPFYSHYTGQPLLTGMILLEQSFTAWMSLLTAISAFGLGRKCQSSPQWCYLHCLYMAHSTCRLNASVAGKTVWFASNTCHTWTLKWAFYTKHCINQQASLLNFHVQNFPHSLAAGIWHIQCNCILI